MKSNIDFDSRGLRSSRKTINWMYAIASTMDDTEDKHARYRVLGYRDEVHRPTLYFTSHFRNYDNTTKHSGEGNAKTITLGLLLAFPSDRKTDLPALLAFILCVSSSIIENRRSMIKSIQLYHIFRASLIRQFLIFYFSSLVTKRLVTRVVYFSSLVTKQNGIE